MLKASSSSQHVTYPNNESVVLNSPTVMPNASGFLWNKNMMLQVNCRGYVTGQFMQPEPSKYSHAPNLEAKSFMQPEHHYYAHHPGRFVYIKDEETNKSFSVPYEPCRAQVHSFNFLVEKSRISWIVEALDLKITWSVTLGNEDTVELWELTIENIGGGARKISAYPYFSVGYMSWMNQSASFVPHLNAIVADSVTPYQKVEDFEHNKGLKDQTYLLADKVPDSWCANQQAFEGEGGLAFPDAVQSNTLPNTEACYEVPVATMQYRLVLEKEQKNTYKFLFGPAKNNHEILQLKSKYLGLSQSFSIYHQTYKAYLSKGQACLEIQSPDEELNRFVNHWLPRQMFYHGDVNRLSTDPQTRNYLQDNMGLCYINPKKAKNAFLRALSQQSFKGSMPDGILLHEGAELKYINQIPHADHAVWLVLFISVYLSETQDISLLDEDVGYSDTRIYASVRDHMDKAMEWLSTSCDERGLSFIAQGDWCDPMNMVGYKGKGVSAWLTLASAYAIKCWHELLISYDIYDPDRHAYKEAVTKLNTSANTHFWQGEWYARGISDNNTTFGVPSDEEGRIYLNPQTWSMLSGACDKQQKESLISQIEQQLQTPFGHMMLAPSYTHMNENIGRLTQKHPGVAENGSVYNHAAIFYAYSLYQEHESDKAFNVLSKMLPREDDMLLKGQLPVFIPNYYRGAYHQFPKHAGRSSQLFNTGTVAWYYRCLVEGLCGLKGVKDGLEISPQLPNSWNGLTVKRTYMKAVFNITMTQSKDYKSLKIDVNGEHLIGNVIKNIEKDNTYSVSVFIPKK